MKEQLKILVACHKPENVYQDEAYTPIHVGRAVSKYKEEMCGMIGDDTGDNISEKNSKYCELTALYWAWKNLHNVTYIGFCHYRRYLGLTEEYKIEKLLKHYDVIALKFHYYHSIYWEILRFISMEHLTILMMVLKKKYPEYEKTMIKYLRGNVLYPKNMFICKKELYDQYAIWLFDILFECEKCMKSMPYSRLERSLAYMGEYLLSLYMMHHQMKMVFVDCQPSPDTSMKIKRRLGRRDIVKNLTHSLTNLIVKKPKILEDYYIEAVKLGLNQDKIEI